MDQSQGIPKAERLVAENAVKKRRFPVFAAVFYGLALLSGILYGCFMLSTCFADWFNGTVSAFIRAILAHLTSWIPFSLAEYCLLMLPVLLGVLIVWGTRRFADTWRDVFIFCGSILAVAALILSIFVMGFAPAYRGTTLDEKLELQRRKVSKEELYETAMILAERVDLASADVAFSEETGFSVMPYDLNEMNGHLLAAYDKAYERYDFLQRLDSRLKPVMLSKAMSYTHITGVYSFFPGEANINVDFPDYTIPFTAAHELAHQRGIAREDEANFMAFLVCIESEDPYVRYSGYQNLYEYVASALYSASKDLYWEVNAVIPSTVKREMSAYNKFFEQYQQSVAADVTEKVNDTFLTIQGTAGTKSYGMVVDLAVAYYVPPKEAT